MNEFSKRISSLTPKQMALLATRLQSKLNTLEQARTEPIAVIGMGCRFPGGASDPQSYWELLRDGRDAVTEIPRERWDADAFYDADPTAPGKSVTRWGAFINGVDEFDAQFFSISPREAMSMDPQQRLLLEVAWEALEDAGQPVEKVIGSKTGVFIGIYNSDYARMVTSDMFCGDVYSSSGNAFSIAANRLSYFFDLQGPSVAIDTACSSSLVGVHFACQSLRTGDSDVALAGGVNLVLSPYGAVHLSKMGMMSARGQCKTFDAGADGFVRGEGVGIVVLKRLSDALAHRDPIHAVIAGSAVNQDGRTNGLTAPNGLSQKAVVIQALANAKVESSQISYVEAHGTGTALGDPIEVESLAAVLGQAGPNGQRCLLGSVKTNMGHLEAAAGIAGLIKVVLSLEHEQIPPHLHFKELNPHIDLQETRLEISTQGQSWPRSETPRMAGVSSFGFGGTNAHVVVEEAPAVVRSEESESAGSYLLPLSARSGAALREMAQRYVEYLSAETQLRDVCYTAGVRRSHHAHRLCVVGSDAEELRSGLQEYVADESAVSGVYSGRKRVGQRPKVAFIFPGQGSQWLGMGRELLQREEVFRQQLQECDAVMRPYLGWSVVEELSQATVDAGLERIDVVQPLLFAMQMSLAAQWRSWGVEPDAVVGHSMGEVAAACVSGVLSLAVGAQVICQRSQLLRRLSGRGAMALVELSAAAIEQVLAAEAGQVSVAAVNSWRTTVISGEREAVRRLVAQFGEENIYSREVKVDVASHSVEVDGIVTELREQLAGVRGQRGTVAMYSTVTGAEIKGEELDGEYWVRNVRQPVQFAAVLEELKRRGHGIYVEVSAHPVLLPAVEEVVRGEGESDAVVVGTMRKEMSERQEFLASVGQLYVSGVEVEWEQINGRGQCVKLPSYAWQRQRYWVEGEGQQRRGQEVSASGHPLLGRRFQTATEARQYFWEMELSVERASYLKDHQVNGAVVLPATAYLEMALAAAAEAFGSGAHELAEVAFEKMLILNDEEAPLIQVLLEVAEAGEGSFQIFSQAAQGKWTRHAVGKVRVAAGEVAAVEPVAAIAQRCAEQITAAQYYEALAESRIEYGESFQIVEEIRRRDGESLGRVRLREAEAKKANAYKVHPVLLDASLQMAAAALPQHESKRTDSYLPVRIGKVLVHEKLDCSEPLWVRAVVDPAADTVQASIYLLDAAGRSIVEIHGLEGQPVGASEAEIDEWFYQIRWQTKPSVDRASPEIDQNGAADVGKYLIFADGKGVAEAICAQVESEAGRCVLVYAGEEFERRAENVYVINPLQGEDFARVLREVDGTAELRVVHLWNLDVSSRECGSAEELMTGQRRSCGSVLHLVQTLVHGESVGEQRLWVVTRAAQPVSEAGEIEAAQAAVWGLGRVIGHEQPLQWGGLIDLDGVGSAAESAAQVLQELSAATRAEGKESEVGYRNGERYVPRLARVGKAERATAEPLKLSDEGSYLITGGLGGLGLEVAKWLVSEGARELKLVGRSAPSEKALAMIAEMSAKGATVECVQADVADESRMREVLEETGKPLRGIIHAAGVLDDGVLLGQDWGRFERVMRAKVMGAWNLAALTSGKELDFFVLFSSAAAVLGSPGQGNYAAANAYLDSLAAARERRGEVGLSINWGAWGEVGLAVREDRAQFMSSRGMLSMRPADALIALSQVMQKQRQGQIAIVALDWDQLLLLIPDWAAPDMLAEITEERKRQFSQRQQFRRQLDAASPDQRFDLLTDHIRGVVAQVLRMNSQPIDANKNFLELGMDSLIGLEVRNRLELSLGVRLSAKLLWDYPTINQLATHLATIIMPATAKAAVPATDNGSEAEQLSVDQTKALSMLLDEIESISS